MRPSLRLMISSAQLLRSTAPARITTNTAAAQRFGGQKKVEARGIRAYEYALIFISIPIMALYWDYMFSTPGDRFGERHDSVRTGTGYAPGSEPSEKYKQDRIYATTLP